jgi:hypothetical protein
VCPRYVRFTPKSGHWKRQRDFGSHGSLKLFADLLLAIWLLFALAVFGLVVVGLVVSRFI